MSPKRAVRSSPKPPRPPEFMDYRCGKDDAWYSVTVRLEASNDDNILLRVMHANFSSDYDETFKAEDFSSEQDLLLFRNRFRRTSKQLQDTECQNMVHGLRVTVSHAFAPDDVRFYDALVHSVNSSEHKLAEGHCSCTFVILWQHGPLAGKTTSTGIENICLIQPKHLKIDPMVEKFLDIARHKLQARKPILYQAVRQCSKISKHNIQDDTSKVSITSSPNSPCGSAMEQHLNKPCVNPRDVDHVPSEVCTLRSSSGRPAVDYQLKQHHVSLYNVEDAESSKQSEDIRPTIIGSVSCCKMGQDIELRSVPVNENVRPEDIHYFIRVENLEKDLSPCDIIDFIRERTSICCQVSVYPGLPEEIYSRGTIFVASKDDADVIFDFLRDTRHIITSLRGRPWVIDINWRGYVNRVFPRYEIPLRNRNKHHSSKIKLVREGSKEFEKARLLHTLHMDFHDHVHKNLLPRLAEEEKQVVI